MWILAKISLNNMQHAAAYIFIVPLIRLPTTTALELIPRIEIPIEHFSHIRHRYFTIAIDIPAHPYIG